MELDQVLTIPHDVRPVEDERVHFYLENRVLIETWAALRAEAASALLSRVPDLVSTLATDLERLGQSDAQANVAESKGRDSVELVRGSWDRASAGSPVRVSLDTEASAIGSRGSMQLFVCIRAKQQHPEADRWVAPIKMMSSELRATLKATTGSGWTLSSGNRYPLYRYLQLTEDDWTIEAILQRAREELLRLWLVAAPAIDRLLDDTTGQSGVRTG